MTKPLVKWNNIGRRKGGSTHHALGAQLVTDARDFTLALDQRCGAGVHRVVAKVEIVRMRNCRTEHEARIGHCFEFDRRIGLVKYGQFTFVDWIGRAQATVHHCDPTDPVVPRRLVGPALAGLELHNEIVDARRCINRADRFAATAEQDARRAVRRDFVYRKMLAERGSQFALWRQGDPQLEGLDRGHGEAGMPHATTGAHPFDVARHHRSFVADGLDIATLPFHRQGQRRDARMRMPAESLFAKRLLRIDEIEKYKRLDHLADVGGADHADDRTVRVAARAEDYVTADTGEGGGRSRSEEHTSE